MVTIFNRAQLLVTRDTNRQARVRDALAAAGIDCVVKFHDFSTRASWDRGHAFSSPTPPVYEYQIYVRRKDLDAARHALGGAR